MTTSWVFVGKPLDSAPDELPFLWAALVLPTSFSGLFGEEQRFDSLPYP
jgi:hypothetical protein